MIRITVVVDNVGNVPWCVEHGLALIVETETDRILFDTGAGQALLPNLERLGVGPGELRQVVLSHGHWDHTGGLGGLSPREVWSVPGVEQTRYSCHPGKPVRELSMPESARRVLQSAEIHEVKSFVRMLPGIYLTGPIPRLSGEDCGGPFYLDPKQNVPDTIPDEQAMLTDDGWLICGCCHCGIINLLQYCRKEHPEISIRSIIGGLHLLNANHARLEQTVDALKEFKIETLMLLHCTGANAVAFLRQRLPECRIQTLQTGDVVYDGTT